MRWRKIAFWSITIVVGFLVLGVSWLWFGDLGVFKPQVEKWVSETTGREFRINGNLSVDLGPRIIVTAHDVTFANADWAGPEHMASVGFVSVEIETASLFNAPIVVESLEINNSRITLTEREDAEPNWVLDIPESETAPESDTDSDAIFLLRDALVQSFELTYESPDREGPIELKVTALNQHVREDGFLDLGIRGTLSGREFRVDGETGTWDAVLLGKDVRYDIDGQFDTLHITSEGHIDDLFAPVAPSLTFSAQGPSIDDLTGMLALTDDGTGNIDLKGSVGLLVGTDSMRVEVTGNLGQTEIATTADFVNLKDLSRIDANIKVSGPDLGRILGILGVKGVQKAPFLAVANIKRDGKTVAVEKAEMVFGDTRFFMTADLPTFPALDDGSLTLNVQGPDIARLRHLTGLPGTATGEFSVDLSLAADAEEREFYELAMQTSHGTLSASGEIKGGDTYLGTTAEIELTLFDVAAMAAAWQVDIGELPADTLEASGRIEYVDDGLRTDGPVSLTLGKLKVRADGLIAIASEAVGSNLLFEIESDELRYITRPFTDTPFVPPESVTMNGRLLVEPGALRFTNLDGTLGDDDVSGETVIKLEPGIAGSTIRFAVVGDQTEQILADVPDLKVRPGPYEVSGLLSFADDGLAFSELRLARPSGELTGSFELGLPVDRNWMRFDLRGDNEDVRSVVASVGDFGFSPQPITLAIDGARDGDRLSFESLNLSVGDASVSANGILELSDNPDATQFVVDINIPDLSRLGTFRGREFNPQAFTLSTSVIGSESQIRMGDLKASMGGSDVNGMILYRTGERPFLEIDIRSDRLVFAPALVPVENPEYEPEPEFKDGRLIPDLPVPFAALDSLDGRFDVDITELGRGRLRMQDISLDATLSGGILELDDFSFRAASGYMRMAARLDPADGEGRAELELMARDFALGMSESNQDLSMRGDIDINVQSTGNDLRTLMGNADGIVFLRTTGGSFAKNRFFQMIYGDLLDEIITTINPFAKSENVTQIECIVAPLRLTNGKLASDPQTFMRTDKINISANTDINLETERLDLGVRTSPRKILTISAAEVVNPYIKVVGTMARPALAVDEQGVLLQGGAAVATGGLSILAKAAWDRLSRSGKPCETTRENGTKAMTPDYPDLEPFPEASVATEALKTGSR